MSRSFFVAVRHSRGLHKHRQIQVQLTADVPGLGNFGSVQMTSPGRMRNELYPKRLANYILRSRGPQTLTQAIEADSQIQAEADLELLKATLKNSQPLTFHCRLRNSERMNNELKNKSIYGSVTLEQVATKFTSENRGLLLRPPQAILEVPEGNDGRCWAGNKIKSVGSYIVNARLKTGEIIPLQVMVRDEKASVAQTEPVINN